MILLEPAYKILHTTVEFKRRTISVTPFSVHYGWGGWFWPQPNGFRIATIAHTTASITDYRTQCK